jgi:hypothetical protein
MIYQNLLKLDIFNKKINNYRILDFMKLLRKILSYLLYIVNKINDKQQKTKYR